MQIIIRNKQGVQCSARLFCHSVKTTKTTQPHPHSVCWFNTTNFGTFDIILTSSVQYDNLAAGYGELCTHLSIPILKKN